MANAASFPHPVYARFVLEPAFGDSQRMLFPHMIAANEAHALMLAATGILPVEQAARLLDALAAVSAGGAKVFDYRPEVEDLFFAVEGRLIELVGADAGGNLQIARSRNDLAAAMARLRLRERLDAVQDEVIALRAVLLDLAGTHTGSIMPGITHTQPAQPTTLAHLLLGVVGPLERDSTRLFAARKRVNRSPLGVAAFTTTSFPIDRELTARLLGFEGIVENGYDAVGASDHLLESVQALVNAVASVSRFVHELLVWTRAESGFLRIDDAFIQISSIMPQKRNPVVLEHVRTRIAWVYGDASTVETMVHSAAFGDTNDVEDPIYGPLDRAFDAATAVVGLLAAVLETATFDTGLMARRATEAGMTTTALADALVRDHGLPFRSAHTIVSRAVDQGGPITAAVVNAIGTEVLGHSLDVDDAFVAAALDVHHFIGARTHPGGPAPGVTAGAIASARARLVADRHMLGQRRQQADDAAADRAAMTRRIRGGRG